MLNAFFFCNYKIWHKDRAIILLYKAQNQKDMFLFLFFNNLFGSVVLVKLCPA